MNKKNTCQSNSLFFGQIFDVNEFPF